MAREPVARQRAKHTRSRLGCGVCRIRRVRCDQTRPACNKCSSTGRKCEGYPPLPIEWSPDGVKTSKAARHILSQSLTLLRPRSSTNSQHSQVQGNNIIFFVRHTSVELAGPLKDDFWTQLVLQVSHREECVQHMVVALSSLHQSQIAADSENLNDQAIQHYTRGLRSLNHHILSNQGAGLDITLLCTIMCVTFEWLRGNQSAAIIHLKAGMKLLEEWRLASQDGCSSPRTSFWSPSGHLIRSTLSPAYRRLYLQAQSVLHDHGLPCPLPEEKTQGEDEGPFESFHEARDGLYRIMCQMYSFQQALPEGTPKDRRKRASQSPKRPTPPVQALAQWHARLATFFEQKPGRREEPGALVLQIWVLTMKIMVGLKDSTDETDCDRFTPAFADIVSLTERLHQQQLSLFCADISIVAVLYYVGIKCRHPFIRRRAISLLDASRIREGIWDSAGAANIIRGLANIEEERAGGDIYAETDLKKDARVQAFALVVDGDSQTWTAKPREVPLAAEWLEESCRRNLPLHCG